MEKEEVAILAQLLASMKDAIIKLEDAYKRKDLDEFAALKRNPQLTGTG